MDWSGIIAAISALVAASTLVWNVVWSHSKSADEAKVRLANLKLERLNAIKSHAAELGAVVGRISHAMSLKGVEAKELTTTLEDSEQLVQLLNELRYDLDMSNETEKALAGELEGLTFQKGAEFALQTMRELHVSIDSVIQEERKQVRSLISGIDA